MKNLTYLLMVMFLVSTGALAASSGSKPSSSFNPSFSTSKPAAAQSPKFTPSPVVKVDPKPVAQVKPLFDPKPATPITPPQPATPNKPSFSTTTGLGMAAGAGAALSANAATNTATPAEPKKPSFSTTTGTGIAATTNTPPVSSPVATATTQPATQTKTNALFADSASKKAGNTSSDSYFADLAAKKQREKQAADIAANPSRQAYYSKPVYERRTTYYVNYHPPIYVTQAPSHYGVWDTIALYAMLDGINDRSMYYNHYNDPGMQSWRAQAELQARDNAELRAKLAALDTYTNQQRQAGVQQDPNYIPPNSDPDLWVSQANQPLTKMTVCTSSSAVGGYGQLAKNVSTVVNMPVTPIPTSGSADNRDRLIRGECDAAIIQADVAATADLAPIVDLSIEAAMLVCAKDVSNDNVYISNTESGSQYTYSQLALGKNVVAANSPLDAVNTAAKTNSCAFSVSSPDSEAMKYADSQKMVIQKINPTKGYITVEIQGGRYHNMKTTDSVGIKAQLVTSKSWAQDHPQQFDTLIKNQGRLYAAK